jgi:hypothetical protein
VAGEEVVEAVVIDVTLPLWYMGKGCEWFVCVLEELMFNCPVDSSACFPDCTASAKSLSMDKSFP